MLPLSRNAFFMLPSGQTVKACMSKAWISGICEDPQISLAVLEVRKCTDSRKWLSQGHCWPIAWRNCDMPGHFLRLQEAQWEKIVLGCRCQLTLFSRFLLAIVVANVPYFFSSCKSFQALARWSPLKIKVFSPSYPFVFLTISLFWL